MKLTHQLISVALFLALGAQAAPSPPDQSNVAFGQGTYDMGNLFKRFQLCGYDTCKTPKFCCNTCLDGKCIN
ncbi:unnamed protein product [Zymoseptoria tritici ST99CH_1A5]|uniref:Uncharacterized protein n=3 Tax=Zymoseptoria tritici TaxID=1047171 RepID=A0A1X7RP99_ZYMT9|nr:unnamed protein product [Zymoseptoria tritici ST99CH_3D7]SMR48867.1 unnamed protein product [Zymoseptoria tritici ST99CH_1E4]SMR50051.1 unnamed protein product [Zymoseptoria tritici ST99CH_3D1]SMY22751.1 unnamed protein product [Zymoseptoria tritici ST99CH_1A5]